MTAYRFFSIKNVQAKNANSFSKTGYHVTADDVTVGLLLNKTVKFQIGISNGC